MTATCSATSYIYSPRSHFASSSLNWDFSDSPPIDLSSVRPCNRDRTSSASNFPHQSHRRSCSCTSSIAAPLFHFKLLFSVAPRSSLNLHCSLRPRLSGLSSKRSSEMSALLLLKPLEALLPALQRDGIFNLSVSFCEYRSSASCLFWNLD